MLAKHLKYQLEFHLPGEDSHLEMMPLYRIRSSEAMKLNPNYKDSAVSVILFQEDDAFHVILTQRNEYEGQHSGQISFPGGKKDVTDDTLLATAIRESLEEIGVKAEYFEFLGEMTSVYIPVSNFKMSPFVFFAEEKPKMVADVREVSQIFTISVKDLLQEDNLSITEISLADNTILKKIPCFKFGNKIVWGATALVLNELKVMLKTFKSE